MNDANPRLLILETSGRVGQVALAQGAAVLSVRRLDETRRHARDLVPAVAELLTAQDWQPRSVAAVLVNRGPGSYTGLRVGIMSAKTFTYATGCILLAIDSFAAIALQAPAEAALVDVIADAQQDRIYVQRFGRAESPPGWAPLSALAIEGVADWLCRRGPGAWISGPGLRLHEARLPQGTLRVEAAQRDPQPESLLRIGLARLRAGERDDLWSVEPLYVRPSSAEVKWNEQAEARREP